MESCLPKEQSMNRIISFKSLAAAAVVLGAMAVAMSTLFQQDTTGAGTSGNFSFILHSHSAHATHPKRKSSLT